MSPRIRLFKLSSILILMITITSLSINPIITNSTSHLYVLGTKYDMDDEEKNYVSNLVYWIVNAAVYGSHGVVMTTYTDEANKDDILEAAGWYSGNPRHVVFIGHGIYWYDDGHMRFKIYTNNGETVEDDEIYGETENRYVKLAFLHSCYQGRRIGEVYTKCILFFCYTVHSGMPQAWLHTTDLSSDGYNNPDGNGYVFIGWYGPAPYLSADLLLDKDFNIHQYTDYMYKFIGYFFSKLYGYYMSEGDVREALDYATKKATDNEYQHFDESPFYNGFYMIGEGLELTKMVVYGDSTYDSW